MADVNALLAESAARHSHLCPRQVLGVRAGLAGMAVLGLQSPIQGKPLIAIVETDGCFVDGIEVATGLTVGHRTLRIEDYGKIAVTFINGVSGEAFRLSPRLDVRQKAWDYAPSESKHYFAQLQAYQVMPDSSLFNNEPVVLTSPIEKIISLPGIRTICDFCGEEIINQREVIRNGFRLCRSCAGPSYYHKKLDEGSDYFSLLTISANHRAKTPPDAPLP